MSVDYWLYRDYIQRSKGEFTVAKDQYVRLDTGWFSDAARVISQPAARSSLRKPASPKITAAKKDFCPFERSDEIADAVKRINADYPKHSRAAYAFAREVFEAENVLKSVLDRAGI